MYKTEFKIQSMCHVLKVSRSGYYSWLRRKKNLDSNKDLLNNIRRVFDESRKNYGSPRIYRQLKSEGIPWAAIVLHALCVTTG
jgi:putative transposase